MTFRAALLAVLLAAPALAQTVTAPGGVAIGRMTGGTVNLQGLSDADRQLLEDGISRLERGFRDELATTARILSGQIEASGAARARAEAQAERLAAELQLSQGAATQILAALGQQNVPADQAMARLQAAVMQYRETLLRLDALQGSRSAAARASREQARAAFAAGRFEEADRLSREAAEAGVEAARRARTLREEAERELLRDAAADIAARGDMALTRLGARGEIALLHRAAAAYQAAGEELTRARTPFEWAMVQNNLGNVHFRLGLRGESAALPRAVAAYEAALGEYTRDRVPLDWAQTQNNLGAALSVMGRAGDNDAARRAIAAYRAALEERRRERAPFQWALTTDNLAQVEFELGERTGEAALLRSALINAEAALDEYRRLDAAPYIGRMEAMRDEIAARLSSR